jgi:hypothetical protein
MKVGVVALAACLVLAACSSSSNNPSPAYSNISGDYVGTMSDAQNGSGAATGTLAQHGNAVGGAITAAQTTTVSAQFSLALSTSNTITGTMVIDYPPANTGPVCTFSVTGSYNTSTNVLSGSYTAVTNCTSDTGTFTLTQQCTDTVTNVDRRRAQGVPSHC